MLFMLLLEIQNDRNTHTTCCLQRVEIKEYKAVTDGKNFFDKVLKNNEMIKIIYDILQEKFISDMIRQLHFLKIISILKT